MKEKIRCCDCEQDDIAGRNPYCSDCKDYSKFQSVYSKTKN